MHSFFFFWGTRNIRNFFPLKLENKKKTPVKKNLMGKDVSWSRPRARGCSRTWKPRAGPGPGVTSPGLEQHAEWTRGRIRESRWRRNVLHNTKWNEVWTLEPVAVCLPWQLTCGAGSFCCRGTAAEWRRYTLLYSPDLGQWTRLILRKLVFWLRINY